jgi:hypothetical protein
MKRFKLIGAMIVAVLALASAFASSASAAFPLPQVLPSTNGNWTGAQVGTSTLFLTLGGAHIHCTSATGSGTTEASKTLGLFHIHFTGCVLLPSTNCTGLGDTVTGTILVLGTWHTVIDVDQPSLAAALMLLLEEVHFSCGIVLIRVKGDVLCLVLEPLSSKASHEFHCTQTNGTTDEKKYFNDSSVETAVPALLSSTSGAPFEEAGELALGTIVYSEAVTIDD